MLLRAIAVVISVLLHVWTGNAMWSLLEKDKLEVFNPGEGLDIVLEPRGLVASEITNVGDSVASIQSLNAVAAVPVPQPAPLRERASEAEALPSNQPPEPAEAAPQVVPQVPVAAPDLLPEVIDSIEGRTAAQVAVVQPRAPPPQRASALPTTELNDVITSQNSAADDSVPVVGEPAPTELSDQDATAPARSIESPELEPRETTPPQISEPAPVTAQNAPAPETFNDRRLAMAAKSVRPDEITEPAPTESLQRAKPEELKDRRTVAIAQPKAPDAAREQLAPQALQSPKPNLLQEPGIAATGEPRPPEPIPEQAPETIEVIAQPQQIVLVTELSSGAEKSGGNATQVGLYLGRISEMVQRSKVNPRSSMTGTTILRFTIGLDGTLLSKEVAQSSGYAVLDDAAITTLDRASPFPPIPPDVSRTPMTFSQPFKFVVR